MGHRMAGSELMAHKMAGSAAKVSAEWTSILDLFPAYSDMFRQTQASLISGNGPLPLLERRFIALMGASTAGCESLERLQEQLFLRDGGDKGWLAGQVPPRLHRLEAVNTILAHRPSSLSPSHIASLLTLPPGHPASDAWTLAEAVQAIVILANYHALSTLCLGVGNRASSSFKIDRYLQMKGRGKAVSLARVREKSGEAPDTLLLLEERRKWRLAQKELKRKRSFSEGEVNTQSELLLKRTELIKTKDAKEKEENKELMVQDFSWDDQGFCVISNFYSDIAVLLDDKFRAANSLATEAEEDKEQEAAFRRAVWNYVQSLFLVRHDDYDYSELEELLPAPLREFLDLCCRPAGPLAPPALTFLSNKLNYTVKVRSLNALTTQTGTLV